MPVPPFQKNRWLFCCLLFESPCQQATGLLQPMVHAHRRAWSKQLGPSGGSQAEACPQQTATSGRACQATHDTLQVPSAEEKTGSALLLSRLMRQALHGPRVALILSRLLPPGLITAIHVRSVRHPHSI